MGKSYSIAQFSYSYADGKNLCFSEVTWVLRNCPFCVHIKRLIFWRMLKVLMKDVYNINTTISVLYFLVEIPFERHFSLDVKIINFLVLEHGLL